MEEFRGHGEEHVQGRRQIDQRVPSAAAIGAIPPPGYPDLTRGSSWTWAGNDTDNDGMLDSWEAVTGMQNIPAGADTLS